MSKSRAFLLAAAAFVVGVAIAGYGASWIFGQTLFAASASGAIADATVTLSVLERLRAGESAGAVDVLEASLDGAIVGIGATIDAKPAAPHQKEWAVLERARRYRAKHPHNSEPPEIAAAVARALSKSQVSE
jgi:hypothetical protein